MPKLDWKVGMKVVNVDENSVHVGARGIVTDVNDKLISVKRDDFKRGSGRNGEWTVRPDSTSWAEIAEPSVSRAESWSYGEADRLYENAVSAINAYNEYIAAKPGTSYYPATTPGRY